MIEAVLDRIATLTERRPRWVVVGGLIAALCSLQALRVPVDLSFAGVMDRSNREVQRYFAASERFGLGGIIPVLLEGPEDRLDDAVVDVQLALDGRDDIREVLVPPPRDWLMARAPYLVDADVFDEWVALAEAPADATASRSVIAKLEALADLRAPRAPPGERLVTIVMSHDTFELALDADVYPEIRRIVRETVEPLGVTPRFSGMPAIVTQEREATLERLRWLGPASLVLVLAILLFVERRLLVLASIAWPMLLSIGCTLALIGSVTGRLTLMESVFGVLVFGLGIDISIHLLMRMREERAAGEDFETSLHRAMTGTGRGVVAGAATTAGAFFILAFSPDPVFRRLGFAGGVGLILCLVFLITALPPQWRAIERRSAAPARRPGLPATLWLRSVAGLCRRNAIVTLVVIAGVVTLSAQELGQIHYETNLERVFSRDIDAVDTAQRIHDLFGIDPSPWVATAGDLDEARALTAAFEAEPTFDRVESLSSLLLPDANERRATLGGISDELTRRVRERELAAMQLEGAAAEGARDAITPLTMLLVADNQGPPELDGLPEVLRSRLVGPDGELIVYAYSAEPALDSRVAARERRVAQSIAPDATSMNVLYEALIGTERPWLPPILAAVVIAIFFMVFLDFRRPRLVLLALLPVTASTIVTVGLLTAFGFSFNTITLVAIPVLLGLGVDDGIHTVHRLIEPGTRQIEDAVGSVAPSILLTTATTCASVGLLLWTRHPGIESVATLLLVGLPMSLLMTVTLLPAAAAILGCRPGAERVAPGPIGEPSP